MLLFTDAVVEFKYNQALVGGGAYLLYGELSIGRSKWGSNCAIQFVSNTVLMNDSLKTVLS